MAFNFRNLGDKYRDFMSTRNGVDQLSRDVFILAVIVLILSWIFSGSAASILSMLGLVCLAYSYFRMLSSRVYERSRENEAYLDKRHALAVKLHLDNVQNPFASAGQAGREAVSRAAIESQKRAERARDKDHKYLKCPKCKQMIRVPKGAGKIRITCPKCSEKFEKKV